MTLQSCGSMWSHARHMCVCGAHIPVTGLSHRSRSRPVVESWMRRIWSKQSRRNSIVLVIMRDPNKSARLDGPKGCKGGGGRGSALLPMDQKTEHHFSHQSGRDTSKQSPTTNKTPTQTRKKNLQLQLSIYFLSSDNQRGGKAAAERYSASW